MLSLTFDDGPDEHWTASVLRTLERCDAKATFFVVGERVRRAATVVEAAVAAGHHIELHCDRHIRHTELSEREIELDTRAALSCLAKIGVHPAWWRTPWGARTPATRAVAERHGLRLVNWTIDTHDWRGDSAASMLAGAGAGALADGGVVLMHDALGPGAQRQGCSNTVELLPKLIAAARAARIEVEPLGDAWLPALAASGAGR